ncbi:RNA polymerase sigma factor [Pontibacter sp. SGAir0037]|uniref:RNA polymerase sigma factor n=1 Tax=Pontibacter sp. SGAir0037 TaxID=2571030 RepID=UPI0010CCB9FA|nr:RNA polymerase sigma-70 factor [Pontibacter sp. SGAir0037]QCR22737.1 hypothetical protein C1N53_10530 [Pontibacter sp. SGAir0037]
MNRKGSECLAGILEAVKADNIAAFEQLYQLCEPKLYSFAMHLTRQKEDAEEVVQEVFLKIWEGRKSLDQELNFDGYLLSIAKHLVYNKARRRGYEFAFKQYLTKSRINIDRSTEEAVAYRDLEKLLEEFYTNLPPVRKQVFLLSRVEGKSNSEIAKLLNTSTSNIENHLNKALKVIKNRFKGYELY